MNDSRPANWWLPTWLDRLLPRVDVEGAAVLPPPDDEDARVLDVPDDLSEIDDGELVHA